MYFTNITSYISVTKNTASCPLSIFDCVPLSLYPHTVSWGLRLLHLYLKHIHCCSQHTLTLTLTHWKSPAFTSDAHIHIPIINGRGCCCQIISLAYLCVWELIFVHLYWRIMLGCESPSGNRRCGPEEGFTRHAGESHRCACNLFH